MIFLIITRGGALITKPPRGPMSMALFGAHVPCDDEATFSTSENSEWVIFTAVQHSGNNFYNCSTSSDFLGRSASQFNVLETDIWQLSSISTWIIKMRSICQSQPQHERYSIHRASTPQSCPPFSLILRVKGMEHFTFDFYFIIMNISDSEVGEEARYITLFRSTWI